MEPENYDDWSFEFQDLWDNLPGFDMFRDYESNIAAQLYDEAFTHHASEPGYDADRVEAARAEFFEFTGLPEDLFPWDEWREAMGYGSD